MKVFLAAVGMNIKIGSHLHHRLQDFHDFNCLESFYYYTKHAGTRFCVAKANLYRDFILDSGAFSFLAGASSGVDWDRYVDAYADVVVQHDICKFIEVDIDPIVGLKRVEELRDRLETRAGRQCIPVWHITRGVDYWRRMTSGWPLVAIGGFVTREIKRKSPVIPKMLAIARTNGALVHGLGIGDTAYPFASVDSSSWTGAVRFGGVNVFQGGKMTNIGRVRAAKDGGDRQAILLSSFESFVRAANLKEMQ